MVDNRKKVQIYLWLTKNEDNNENLHEPLSLLLADVVLESLGLTTV